MSARLSPAASLLRNSKLFALPPQIALPAAPPSADTIAQSDTATTIHPQFAAIETAPTSGAVGDWGFKRPLPLKTVKTTRNPVVRVIRGIDTPEHIVDFESAADHVLNLRKFQALDLPIRHEEFRRNRQRRDDRDSYSVFRNTHDNTTNLSATAPANVGPTGSWPNLSPEEIFTSLPKKLQEQKLAVEEARRKQDEAAGVDPKSPGLAQLNAIGRTRPTQRVTPRRWRYGGPSLVQMSGMEFDDFVHSLGEKERSQLTERIKKEIVQQKLAMARQQGTMDHTPREADVTQEEVRSFLRYLRNEPRKFGPIITEMLDLPEGQTREIRENVASDTWEYGRDTLAVKEWRDKGPPRTHPSAGLSYLQSTAHSTNHPVYGPQKAFTAALARTIKVRYAGGSEGTKAITGLAGFVAKLDAGAGGRTKPFSPTPGGQKVVVTPGPTYITEKGEVSMSLVQESEQDFEIRDNKPVFRAEVMAEERLLAEQMPQRQAAPMPMMSSADAYTPRAPRRFEGKEDTAILDKLDPSSRSKM